MQIPIFAHVSAISHLLPAYAGIRRWKFLQFPRKIFALFLVFTVFVEVLEFTLGRFGIHNILILNIYRLMEFECLAFLYFKRMEKQLIKDFIKSAGILYLLIWGFEVSFDPFPKEFSELIIVVANILLIVISIVLFYHLSHESKERMSEFSVFWIGIAAIAYCSGTVIVFTLSNQILKMGMEYFDALWHINWTLTVVANILYARSFSCKIF